MHSGEHKSLHSPISHAQEPGCLSVDGDEQDVLTALLEAFRPASKPVDREPEVYEQCCAAKDNRVSVDRCNDACACRLVNAIDGRSFNVALSRAFEDRHLEPCIEAPRRTSGERKEFGLVAAIERHH